MNSGLFRDVISLDWDDALTLLLAIGAVVGVFVTRRSRSEETIKSEVVDAGVLEQFRQLFEKIGALEVQVAAQKISLDMAHTEIREMRKLEEYLQATIHQRESQIIELKEELVCARARIDHLELVCKRAGINGDDLEP